MIGMTSHGPYIAFSRALSVFDKSVVYKHIVLKEEFYHAFDMKTTGENIPLKNVHVSLSVKIITPVVFELETCGSKLYPLHFRGKHINLAINTVSQ